MATPRDSVRVFKLRAAREAVFCREYWTTASACQ
jgi:hypothetical protein